MTHPLFRKEMFVETAFAKRFQRMLQDAWDNRSWHLLVADLGTGKTMSIRDLQKRAGVILSRLKSAAELLVLRHDTLKIIDGAGPDALVPKRDGAEPASVNGTELETVLICERQDTTKTVETAKEQGQTSTSPKCTFSSEVVAIDLKRFAGSSVALVECPDCSRTRSLSERKGVLRFPSHDRRKMQTLVTSKRWAARGKTGWDVVEG